MKKKLILILTVCSGFVYSQNTYEKTDISTDSIIKQELKILKSRDINNIMAISDNLGNVFVLWKEQEKGKILRFKKNSRGRKKRCKSRLSKKNNIYFEQCFKNHDVLKNLKNTECRDTVRSCIEVYVECYSGSNFDFSNKFFLHFDSKEKKKSILFMFNLYQNLVS